MDKIEITFKIITPMFMGGASSEPELRAPSIKGALRFWYRATTLNYQQHETRIFGGSNKNEGQAKFLLRIEKPKITSSKQLRQFRSLTYGVTDRSHIPEKGTFSIKLLLKPNISPEDTLGIKRALWAFIMFGGLGSRSRKGLGSLAVDSFHGMDDMPSLTPEISELNKCINTFLSNHVTYNTSSLPEYTCWSNQSRCVISGEDNVSSINTLTWLSNKVHELRSTQGSNIFNWPKADCDKMRSFSENGSQPRPPPLRAAFGLPHNYYFSDLNNRNVDMNYMEGDKKGRRASPLFFKVYEKNDKACLIAIFLPARLIPENRTVRIEAYKKLANGQKITAHTTNVELPNNFHAINDMLNELEKCALGKKVK